MKSKITYLMPLAFAGLMLASCDKDTEGLTSITYYPTLELLGEAEQVLYVGDSFVDEGCYAELNGEDVSDQIIVDNGVDTSKMGVYGVSYIVYNEDGFSASATRTVYVVKENSVENIYWGDVDAVDYGRSYRNAVINITDNGDGTYQIDDLLGGYYFNGVYPGYEPSYDFHVECNFSIDADGNFTQVGGTGNWYWASTNVGALTGCSYDAATGVMTLDVYFDALGQMIVTLNPMTKD